MKKHVGLTKRVAAAALAVVLACSTLPGSVWASTGKTTVDVTDDRPAYTAVDAGRIFDYHDDDVDIKLRVSGTAKLSNVEYPEGAADVFNANGFDVLIPKGYVSKVEFTDVRMEAVRLSETDAGYDDVMVEAGQSYDQVYKAVGLTYHFYLGEYELDMSGCAIELSAGWSDDALGDAGERFLNDMDVAGAAAEHLSMGMSAYAMTDGNPVLAVSESVALPGVRTVSVDIDADGDMEDVNEGDNKLEVMLCGSSSVVDHMTRDAYEAVEDPGFEFTRSYRMLSTGTSLVEVDEDPSGDNGTETEPETGTGHDTGLDSDSEQSESSTDDPGDNNADRVNGEEALEDSFVGSNGPSKDDFPTFSGTGSWIIVNQYGTWLVIGSGVNFNYDVEFYAYLPVLTKDKTNGDMMVIDTRKSENLGLPTNGEPDAKYEKRKLNLYLDQHNTGGEPTYTLKTHTELREIYEAESYEYQKIPRAVYMDKVSGSAEYDANYVLSEIWVLKAGQKPENMSDNDWKAHIDKLLKSGITDDNKLSEQDIAEIEKNWTVYREDGIDRLGDETDPQVRAHLVKSIEQVKFLVDANDKRIEETNNKEFLDVVVEDSFYILLNDESHIRLVYVPKYDSEGLVKAGALLREDEKVQRGSGFMDIGTTFYDYDISEYYVNKDGKRLERDGDTWYVKNDDGSRGPALPEGEKPIPVTGYIKYNKPVVNGFGINDIENNVNVSQLPSGYVPFAFGNGTGSCGSGMGELQWNNRNINKIYRRPEYNSVADKTSTVKHAGGVFGLVDDRLNADGTLQFTQGIAASPLFQESGTVRGKTVYPGSRLRFKQVGDTYTLYGAQVRDAEDLSQNKSDMLSELDIFYDKAGAKTNMFWPLDKVPGNDGLVGSGRVDGKLDETKYEQFYRCYRVKGLNADDGTKPGTGSWSPSDDGDPHNCLFGMHYELDFEFPKDYVGPLEYFFYGDDDMWVYLSDYSDNGEVDYKTSQLVCDIGGVHRSVGEYVDLWDYIDPDGDGVYRAGKYRLSVFYLERGLAGSVCYTQFTLPNVTQTQEDVLLTSKRTALVVSKAVGSISEDGNVTSSDYVDKSQEFEFLIKFKNKSGEVPQNLIGNITGSDGRNDRIVLQANGVRELDKEVAPEDLETFLNSLTGQDSTNAEAMWEEWLANHGVHDDGSVSSTLKLRAGDKCEIFGLEPGMTYEIQELATNGYVSGAVVDKGVPEDGTGGTSEQRYEVYEELTDGKIMGTVEENKTTNVRYVNKPLPSLYLPATGGGGPEIYIAMGMVVILFATTAWLVNKKRLHVSK